MSAPRRVLCIEDERCFADALRLAIDLQPDLTCVGVATGAAKGIDAFQALRPDVVVVDLGLPDGSGIDVVRRIRRSADALVIVLTGYADAANLAAAVDAGADGFLPKDAALDDVLAVLRRRDRGMRLDATNVRTLGRASDPAEPVPHLTPREAQVLTLLAAGERAKAIARRMGISLETCRGYIRSLLEKLHAHTQLEAVLAAERLGLVDSPGGGHPQVWGGARPQGGSVRD